VPGLVLAEVDYFLRESRAAMRKLVAELFDARTRYEYELPLAFDIVRDRAHPGLRPRRDPVKNPRPALHPRRADHRHFGAGRSSAEKG